MVDFKLWQNYTRKQIAEYWGYSTQRAIWRGVVCPKNTGNIYLFVTQKNQKSLTQYNDGIYGSILHWEGEQKHQNDKRIINAHTNGEKIFLFFRMKYRRKFIYFGRIHLLNSELKTEEPSRFLFEIETLSPLFESRANTATTATVIDFDPDMTDRTVLRKERVGHDKWRHQLLQLWNQSCSVTGLQEKRLLRASHIKPWRHSSDEERLHPHNGLVLNPSLDCLFDCGFITFLHPEGHIKISNVLGKRDRKILNVRKEMSLRKTFPKNREYLEYHNDCVFEKWIKARDLQYTFSS